MCFKTSVLFLYFYLGRINDSSAEMSRNSQINNVQTKNITCTHKPKLQHERKSCFCAAMLQALPL